MGFDTDIGRQFAKDLLGDENKVEFVAVEPASRIPFLQSDKVDLILANMTVTPDRKEAVEFTNPNLKVAVQALVPNGSEVKNLDDLASRTTIVTTGTTADIWLTKNHPDWKLLKFEKNSESLQALANGRGDAYAQDNLILFSWSKQNPGYRVLPQTLGEQAPIAPAVKKGNIELRDWVNAELAKLGEDKYLLKLYDQYVRKELSDDTQPESVIVEGGKWQG
ncbi:Amino acid ABC transporter, substrate-binding protein [Pseudomonas chlororaphis subsp. aureofaciens]|nr:Amino acid ABC transporter, substrate-binding protein [Pseudomonas chlororaphis subsp. aureofaciens]SUD57639.1 glutamine-binding protein GlnH [Pseudomonas chlororaphis]